MNETRSTDDNQIPLAAGGMALFVLGAQQFIMAYDTTAMNVAISQIVEDLNTTLTGVQTAITLYALVMASLMMVGAALGDVFGRKRIFTIGALIYGFGALVTALSRSLTGLILGWSLLEGIGAALVLPVILSLVIINFTQGPPRTRAFTVIAALAAVGATLGPLLGGLLTTYLSWRVSFALEVLVVLVVVGLTRHLNDSVQRESMTGFDFAGAVISALGFTFIVFGLLLVSSYGFFTARKDMVIGDTVMFNEGGLSPVVVFVLIGVGILVLFAFWESRRIRKGQEPLIRPALLMLRSVRIGTVEMALLFLVQFGVMFVVPVYTQISLQYTAIQSGVAMIPLSLAVIIVSLLLPKINEHRLPRVVIRVGFLVLAVGCFFIASGFIPLGFEVRLSLSMILVGIGLGLVTALIQSVVLSVIQTKSVGEVSGLARSLSYLGSSLGTALAGGVLVSVLIGTATSLAYQSSILTAAQQEQMVVALEGDVQAVSDTQMTEMTQDLPADVQAEVVSINAQARDTGLGAAMAMLGVFSLLALGISFRLPGRDMPPDLVHT
jgi:MFS family permease